MNSETIFPVITLYQPWATWVVRGWKTIETRTHSRFSSLLGRTILIHAGMKTDLEAVNNPYLLPEQISHKPEEMVNGYILGSAAVVAFRELNTKDEPAALIECSTLRYGLFLSDITQWEQPYPAKGEMGIWYWDTAANLKVKKSKNTDGK